MKVIVALGNPGEKYRYTRHNAGFLFAEFFARRHDLNLKFEKRFNALIAKGEGILLVLPQTYMNLSGEALRAVLDFYKIPHEDIFLVYDDISLDLGRIRFRANGSDGGHNGIKSVIKHLGGKSDFGRLKIGIGRQIGSSESFVLQNFTPEQLPILKKTLTGCVDAVDFYLANGILEAQNKYNGIDFAPE